MGARLQRPPRGGKRWFANGGVLRPGYRVSPGGDIAPAYSDCAILLQLREELFKWTDRTRSEPEQHWKNPRTRVRHLLGLSISREKAVTTGSASKGCWRMSQVKWVMIAMPNRSIEKLGLVIPWD
jgi:hypothetical protein